MIIEDIKRLEGKGFSGLIMLIYMGSYPEDEEILVAVGERYGYGSEYEVVDIETTEDGGKVYIKEVH